MEIQISSGCCCRSRLHPFILVLFLVTVAGLQEGFTSRQRPNPIEDYGPPPRIPDIVGVEAPQKDYGPSPGIPDIAGVEPPRKAEAFDSPDVQIPDALLDMDGKPRPTQNAEKVEYLQANAALRFLDAKKYPNARCLDGSIGGYYYKPASTTRGSRNWLIHLQGGGECAELDRCNILKLTKLGSSWLFPRRHSFYGDAVDIRVAEEGSTILANYQVLVDCRKKANPDFYDWNMVFVPYCSQDLWTGRRKQASDQTHFVYFAGAHIYQAVIDTLDNEFDMGTADGIVLTGDSAGGYGVYAHLDSLAESHPLSKVVGSSVGGMWQYAKPYQGFGHTKNLFSDFRRNAWPEMMDLWAAEVPPSCGKDHPRKADCLVMCSKDPYPWTYLKTRLFIVEAQTDNVLATYHNWVPMPPMRLDGMHDPRLYPPETKKYLSEFGRNMTQCMREGLRSLKSTNRTGRFGIFSPACFAHTNFENNIKIQGRSYLNAFGDFFFERGPTPLLMDEGFLTNPTCGDEYFNVMI